MSTRATYLHVEFLSGIGLVNGHMLNSHQVLTGGDLSGQLESKLALVPGEPSLVCPIPRNLCAELVDLEPITGAVVFTHITWRLGQVDLVASSNRSATFVTFSGGS